MALDDREGLRGLERGGPVVAQRAVLGPMMTGRLGPGLPADLAPRLNTIQVGFPYVLKLLAKALGLPITSLEIIRGGNARTKIIAIAD